MSLGPLSNPASSFEPGHAAPRRRLPRARTVVAVIAAALLAVVALLPAPYVIERPGPVFNTLGTTGVNGKQVPVISVKGHATYPTSGRLDLLTVSALGQPGAEPSWLDLATSWFDSAQRIVPMEDVYAPGVTSTEADQQSAEEMAQSQQSAIAAALTDLGQNVHGTVTVQGVVSGEPASGVLKKGDVVRTVNGATMTEPCAVQSAVVSNGAAKAAVIGITRDGTARTVRITPRLTSTSSGSTPVIGIYTSGTFRFPFTVTLRLQDVGGPSAGMMFALGIIDTLTPGSLTGGVHVAGTGTICSNGQVGAIGGIVQKMVAAQRAGATVFLAPSSNCSDVVGHVPSGLTVYAVSTLDDSLAVLKAVRDRSSTAHLATCRAG